jgi:hypothetical protein
MPKSTPCISETAWRFIETYFLHLRCRLAPTSTGFLLGLLFYPEDGGDILLRNVGLSPNCMALLDSTAVIASNPTGSTLFWNYVIIHRCEANLSVAARSEVWTVFASSNTGIVGSNHTQGMDVCMRLFCVSFVLCRQRPCDGLIPVQGVLVLKNWSETKRFTDALRSKVRATWYIYIYCWEQNGSNKIINVIRAKVFYMRHVAKTLLPSEIQ